MEKKHFWLAASACSLVLLVSTFIHWPLLGHDYSLIVPGLIDLKVAWVQHGVLNPLYSPLKCLGSPLWANPVSFNLSLLHLVTLISNDLVGIVLFIILISVSSFWGAFRLSRRMNISENYSLYLACGWTLQGWMISRAAVGHLTYITVGWFPLIIYLLMKQTTLKRDVLSCFLAAVLLSQYVFLAAPYTPFFFVFSCLILLPLLLLWKKNSFITDPHFYIKGAASGLMFLAIIYPKIHAVKDLMAAYPRHVELSNVGVFSLPYSVLNLFSFFPHDYKKMVGWWYGNWESVQFIFPMFFAAAVVVLLKAKEEAKITRVFVSVFYIVFVSFILCSGLLGPVFQKLPFLSSMHVNPRWNIVTALPVFFVVASLMSNENLFPNRWFQALFILVLSAPFFHLSPENFGISYAYKGGYHQETHRLTYCYEPFLGYSLENFPMNYQRSNIDFIHDDLIDPRCYLPSRQCEPGSPLRDDEKLLLQTYKLQ